MVTSSQRPPPSTVAADQQYYPQYYQRGQASASNARRPIAVSALDGNMRDGSGQSAASYASLHAGKNNIYEKAFALSRSTSIRQPHREYDEDSGDTDDNEQAENRAHDGTSHAGYNGARGGQARQTARQGSMDTLTRVTLVDDGPGPRPFQNPSSDPSNPTHRRDSDQLLLRGAFRESMASDASFNTITGEAERNSIMFGGGGTLRRRDSTDTVKTAEFDAEGRWGRAWADRAEDEESLYAGSEWGSSSMDEGMGDRGDEGNDYASRGLGALRQLAQGKGLQALQGLTMGDVASGGAYQVYHQDAQAYPPHAENSAFHLQPIEGRERIVSLTPSVHGGSMDQDAATRSSRPSWQTHQSSDSASTIGKSDAHIYVWPPTPQGSETSHRTNEELRSQTNSISALGADADAASIHEWEAVSDYGDDDEESDSAAALTMSAQAYTPQGQETAAGGQSSRAPVTVSGALASGQVASQYTDVSAKKGHPTGRAPPPPPSSRYQDPNTALPSGHAGVGRTRAAAIAAADGRESIISDLDVETLRLGGSSRRDSSSTIDSRSSSRMSVGTIHYDEAQEPHDRRDTQGRSASQQLPTTEAAARSRATPMSRAVTTPTTPSRPVLGSHPPPTPLSPSGGSVNSFHTTGTSIHAGDASAPPRPPLQGRATSHGSAATTPAKQRGAVGQDTKTGPTAAENFLTQGIAYHEQGDMSRSAYYFERSAKVEGGCVVGMCMWGMTLREGWGARKDPRKGFEWIQRAAAKAGDMMSSANGAGVARSEVELKAVRSELKLSVYELGKCFCYGWGIKMDKRMALEYFELAAKLGDADAQAEAGALYAAGKGCKKDLKRAAKYYRMAAAQGYDLIGLSWVWKSKFDA